MPYPQQVEAVRAGVDAVARWRVGNPDVELDLSGGDLRGLDPLQVRLENVNLAGADLTDTRLSQAGLSGVNPAGVSVVNVNLFWSDLKGANLEGAAPLSHKPHLLHRG